MSALPNTVIGLPVSFDSYIRHGWKLVAIPQGSKGPNSAAWNRKENAVTDSTMIPPGHGVGLAHAYSGTCAIDIDNWDAAIQILSEHHIDLNQLYNALDAVTVESGRQGHGKLLYAMPFGITLPSKKINYTDDSGTKQVAYELRCASTNGLTLQDVLPPSIHPITNQPYRWGGRGTWNNLPTIPTELLTLWQELTAQDTEKVIPTDTVDASWDDIKAALYAVPADTTRDEWLTCGMALHHAGTVTNNLDHAMSLFHEWSATKPLKYKGSNDIRLVWRSFKVEPHGIKTASLFHIAKQHGYKRPMPDVSTLFRAVTPEAPTVINETLSIPPPEMDMTLWPDIIRLRSLEVAESVGCDPLVPLFAGLATVCGAVDARTRLELMPGYQVPPLLWFMTIGDPADKKTPGARPMMHVLHQLEREDIQRYERSLLEWEALDNIHQQSRKAYILAAGQSTETLLTGKLDDDTLPPVAPPPPGKPVNVKLLVEDVTSQKLVRIVADRPRGVLCHLDEMSSWVNKLTDPRSGEDRSCWTKSYEADPYTMDRVGSENTIFASNMAVSIYGNIQPAVFKERLRQMSNDGLLQRFIPSVLRAHHTKRGEPIPDMFSTKAAWEMKVREIYALPVYTYHLDPEAYKQFREFQSWYELTKQDERLLAADPIYMQAFGKLEGTCGRIILLMHLMDNPYSATVNRFTTMQAIKLVKTFLIPTYRYALGEAGGLQADSLERWCAERVVQLSGNVSTVTCGEIRSAARRQLENTPRGIVNQVIADAMEPLEQAKWVTVIEDTKNRKTWAINPAIATQYEDHRLTVIKAKQRRLDQVRDNVLASGKTTPRRLAKGYDPATMD